MTDRKPMTPSEMAKKRWAGVSKEERRRLALKAVAAREAKRKLKRDSVKQAD